MPTTLEPRPTTPVAPEVTVRVVTDEQHRASRPRRSITGTLGRLAFAAIAIGLAFALLGAITGFLTIGNPFKATTTDHSPRVLLKELRDLADFQAAEATFQSRVELETDVPILPSFIAGSKVDFDATGTVAATFDFGALTTEAVQVDADGAVVVTLEPPTLQPAVVDPKRSRVVNRDRGVVNRIGDFFEDDPTSERELYLRAERKMDKAARESNLATRAERNTDTMLRGFLTRLGFTDVTVVFVPTAEPAKE